MNKFLTLLFSLFVVCGFAQSFNGTGGPINDATTTNYPVTVSNVAGSTIAGGTCNTGIVVPNTNVPAVLGYNTRIKRLTVTNIQHTWADDIDMFLVAPNGTQIEVTTDNGGSTCLDATTTLVFDVTATNSVVNWTAATCAQSANPFLPEGSFSPAPASGPACSINAVIPPQGINVNGGWVLRFIDDAGGDVGSFASFTLQFEAITPPTFNALTCCETIECELEGQTTYSVALEAGECAEFVNFDAPTLVGPANCKICTEGSLAGAVTANTGATSFTESFNPQGNLNGVTLVALNGNTGSITYTATASVAGTVAFNWSYSNPTDAAFWDPFVINGPAGNLLTFNQFVTAGAGSFSVPVLAGQSITFNISSLDGFGGPATAVISNLSLVPAANAPYCFRIVQTSGIDDGSYQPVGSYPIEWEAQLYVVVNGTEILTTFAIPFDQTVNVLPYSGPQQTALACNDHVNISVDELCEVPINADMFLEGGPYGCYDDYEVYIWINNNQNNSTGDVSGTTVDFEGLLGNHGYKVVDPETGNSCWGTFKVEDKLAPEINCADVTVNCITSAPLAPEVADFSVLVFAENTTTTGTVAYTASMPINRTVNDINFEVIGNFPGFDWGITLTSPSGTTATVWPVGISGCGNWNFIVDTDAPDAPLTCVDLQSGANWDLQNTFLVNFGIAGVGALDVFNGEPSIGTWTATVVGSGTITRLAAYFNDGVGFLTGLPFPEDACGDATITFSDVSLENQCGGIVARTWTITDASGNKASCVQNISVNPLTLADVVLPPSLVVTNCGTGTTPEEISAFFDVDSRTGAGIGGYNDDYTEAQGSPAGVVEFNEGYPIAYPHVFVPGFNGVLHPQKIDNNICNIFAQYTDVTFPACGVNCGGNTKIIRTWTLLDWCGLQAGEFLQLIKAVDLKAPTFIVKDITVSVNPWGCVANFDVPMPWELQDNCDAHPHWTVQGPAGVTITGNPVDGFKATGAPKGVHQFLYKAWDCCGNESFAVALVTVIDRSAPVAVAKQNIVISLTGSGTGGDGAAKLYAYHVDNGSYDHCSPVRLEIRRPDGAPDCGNLGIDDHNNNVTFDDDDSASPNQRWAHPNDDRDDTDNGEYVKFCCEDLAGGTSVVHQAILRVWDDGNMNGVIGDNLILDGMQDNYNETWADIRVEDKLPPTLVCPDDVTLTCDMDLNISEGVWTSVDGVDMTMTGGPAVAYALCSGNPVEYRDVPTWTNTCKNVGRVRREFRSVKGAITVNCYQIITVAALPSVFTVTPPTASIVDTDCDFTEADIKDSEKPRVLSGPCDVIGENIDIDTFFFEDGVCKKWRVTYEYINWCTGEIKAGGVKWYKYKDDEKPVLTCGDAMFPANPNPQNPNGVCEGTVSLTASATDAGGCTDNGWLKWVVFVDLWGNGSIDLEYSSFLPTTDNNLGNDTNNNGIPDRYVAPTSSGGTVTIPAFILDAELSTHKVSWKVTDGCGNFTQCSSTFMVVDKKAPTPYCVSLSSAVMENGEVELWAKDFDKGSFDNCTPQNNLLFTFNGEMPVWANINVEHYFKGIGVLATAAEYAAGNAQRWSPSARSSAKIFDCEDVENSPIEVQMTVWDQSGNNDYCSVTLTLIDNQGGCGGSRIAGKLVNHANADISNVIVSLDPSVGETKVETFSGSYNFKNLPAIDYNVAPSKTDDYKNGVSTLDLVHIQRHILGTAKLNSAEKLIAADVNNDKKITANDLVELRKLILGLTTKLNNNDSWTFVPKSYVYPDATNPYNAPRSININNLTSDKLDQDFTGIKIGDVDQNASASFAGNTSGNRSAKNLTLSAEDKSVVSGDVVTIDVTANNFKDVFGYQFTANLAGMELVEVKSGAIAMDETNYGVPAAGKMTMSWSTETGASVADGEVLFTLVMRANNAGKVSNMIALSSDVTSAESYGANMNANGIELNFRNGDVQTAGYALYQNEPNPFKATTSVSFNMAQAGKADFTLTDVTGKVVYTRTVDAVKGMNTVEFSRNDVTASGIVYYTITSGDFTATKAMIVIE